MLICDRCGGKREVLRARLQLNVAGSPWRYGDELDLCGDCRATVEALVLVPNLTAAGILAVLDGEPEPLTERGG